MNSIKHADIKTKQRKHYAEHMGLNIIPTARDPSSPLLINMIFKLCITMLTEPTKHLTATSVHLWVYEYTVWIHAWSVSSPSCANLGIDVKHAVSKVHFFTHSASQETSQQLSHSVIALTLRFFFTATEHIPELRSHYHWSSLHTPTLTPHILHVTAKLSGCPIDSSCPEIHDLRHLRKSTW